MIAIIIPGPVSSDVDRRPAGVRPLKKLSAYLSINPFLPLDASHRERVSATCGGKKKDIATLKRDARGCNSDTQAHMHWIYDIRTHERVSASTFSRGLHERAEFLLRVHKNRVFLHLCEGTAIIIDQFFFSHDERGGFCAKETSLKSRGEIFMKMNCPPFVTI